jgi:hypothetical protein
MGEGRTTRGIPLISHDQLLVGIQKEVYAKGFLAVNAMQRRLVPEPSDRTLPNGKRKK